MPTNENTIGTPRQFTRRHFVKALGGAALTLPFAGIALTRQDAEAATRRWRSKPTPTPTATKAPTQAPATPTATSVATSTPAALPGGLNVRDFGARGDGVTDDTAAFKAALAAAASGSVKIVSVPAGTYMIAASPRDTFSGILVPDGCTLQGAGAGATILRVIPGSVTNASANWNALVARSNTRLSGFELDGSRGSINRSGMSSMRFHGIYLATWAMQNVVFENLKIHDLIGINDESFGTMLNKARNVLISNVEAYNIEGTGIHVDGDYPNDYASGVTVDGAVVHDNTWAGISIYSSTNVVARNVTAYNNTRNGINVEWSDDITVENSTAWNNGQAGVGTWGWVRSLTLNSVSTQHNGVDNWFGAEVGLRANKYWKPNPNTGVTDVAVCQLCTLSNCTLDPNGSGLPNVSLQVKSDATTRGNIVPAVDKTGAGVDQWIIIQGEWPY